MLHASHRRRRDASSAVAPAPDAPRSKKTKKAAPRCACPRVRVSVAIAVLVTFTIYFALVPSLMCGLTDICATAPYFSYNGTFVVWGAVRTSHTEYVLYACMFAGCSFLSGLNFFFVYSVAAKRLYSDTLDDPEQNYGVGKKAVFALAFVYTVFLWLGNILFVAGATNNLIFSVSTAIGGVSGHMLGWYVFVFQEPWIKGIEPKV